MRCLNDDLNRFQCRYIGKRFIVEAARDIKNGEEIYNCYGLQADRYDTEERKAILKYQYGFDCECESCSE
jgi:SET and MYND domain-containing protein 4